MALFAGLDVPLVGAVAALLAGLDAPVMRAASGLVFPSRAGILVALLSSLDVLLAASASLLSHDCAPYSGLGMTFASN